MDSRLIILLVGFTFLGHANSFPSNSSLEGIDKKNETLTSNLKIEYPTTSIPNTTTPTTSTPPTSKTTTQTTSPATETTTISSSPTTTTPKPTTNSSTSASTTPKPTTPTTTTNSTKPTNPAPPTTPNPTTPSSVASSTATPGGNTTPPVVFQRQFDGPSFIGGIVLTVGLTAIGFIAFKFYIAGKGGDSNYRTLY